MRTKATFLALPLAIVALAGCGSSSSSSSHASAATAATSPKTPAAATMPAKANTVMVSMKGLAFMPATIHAKVGETVMWMNMDTPQHTVTYVSGPKFHSSGDINPGGMFSIKLTQAGTIHYMCKIHPFMLGTIIVTQ
jgi:plastocyanin